MWAGCAREALALLDSLGEVEDALSDSREARVSVHGGVHRVSDLLPREIESLATQELGSARAASIRATTSKATFVIGNSMALLFASVERVPSIRPAVCASGHLHQMPLAVQLDRRPDLG
jgi:hypothetical protein